MGRKNVAFEDSRNAGGGINHYKSGLTSASGEGSFVAVAESSKSS